MRYARDITVQPLLFGTLALATVSLLSGWSMQWVQGVSFPPPISVSTYGLGPGGWVFTVCMTAVALASALLFAAGARIWPVMPRGIAPLIAVWVVCVLIVGWVRTSAPGEPITWWVYLHRTSAVVGMVAFPIAISILTRHRMRTGTIRGPEAAALATLTIVSAISLVLVALGSAARMDIFGMSHRHAPGLYEFVAGIVDITIIYVLSISGLIGSRARTVMAQDPAMAAYTEDGGG